MEEEDTVRQEGQDKIENVQRGKRGGEEHGTHSQSETGSRSGVYRHCGTKPEYPANDRFRKADMSGVCGGECDILIYNHIAGPLKKTIDRKGVVVYELPQNTDKRGADFMNERCNCLTVK